MKGAPDLAIEVLSPNDRRSEVEEKISDWLGAGARMVWLVDPEARTIAVHRAATAPRVVASGGTVDGEDVLPGFSMPVDAAFLR